MFSFRFHTYLGIACLSAHLALATAFYNKTDMFIDANISFVSTAVDETGLYLAGTDTTTTTSLIIKLANDHTQIWRQDIGVTGSQTTVKSIALDRVTGNVFAVGSSTVNFDGQSKISNSTDSFIVIYSPNGNRLTTVIFGSPNGNNDATSVSIDSVNRVVAVCGKRDGLSSISIHDIGTGAETSYFSMTSNITLTSSLTASDFGAVYVVGQDESTSTAFFGSYLYNGTQVFMTSLNVNTTAASVSYCPALAKFVVSGASMSQTQAKQGTLWLLAGDTIIATGQFGDASQPTEMTGAVLSPATGLIYGVGIRASTEGFIAIYDQNMTLTDMQVSFVSPFSQIVLSDDDRFAYLPWQGSISVLNFPVQLLAPVTTSSASTAVTTFLALATSPVVVVSTPDLAPAVTTPDLPITTPDAFVTTPRLLATSSADRLTLFDLPAATPDGIDTTPELPATMSDAALTTSNPPDTTPYLFKTPTNPLTSTPDPPVTTSSSSVHDLFQLTSLPDATSTPYESPSEATQAPLPAAAKNFLAFLGSESTEIIFLIVGISFLLATVLACWLLCLRNRGHRQAVKVKSHDSLDPFAIKLKGNDRRSRRISAHSVTDTSERRESSGVTELSTYRTVVNEGSRDMSIPAYMEYKARGDFTKGNEIARGGASVIYEGVAISRELREIMGSKKLIIKQFNEAPTADFGPTYQAIFHQEVALMHFFKDDSHFVKMYGFVSTPKMILMKAYASSLRDLFENRRFLWSPKIMLGFMADVSLGLKAMHTSGFSHCDLKSDNVLIERRSNGEYSCVIADLGIAQIFDDKNVLVTAFRRAEIEGGSLCYCAPEIIALIQSLRNIQRNDFMQQEGRYLCARDVYAFALLQVEVLSRRTILCMEFKKYFK